MSVLGKVLSRQYRAIFRLASRRQSAESRFKHLFWGFRWPRALHRPLRPACSAESRDFVRTTDVQKAGGPPESKARAAFSASSIALDRLSMVITRLGCRKRNDTSFTWAPVARFKASAYAPPCRR